MVYKAKTNAKIWERFDGEALLKDVGIAPAGVIRSGRADSRSPWVLRLDNGTFSRLDKGWWEKVQVVEPPANIGTFVVKGDEELERFDYKSRTLGVDWAWEIKQAPSVFRISPTAEGWGGEYRVDITRLDKDIRRLNRNVDQAIEYLYGSGVALFNRKGFPFLQYLVMSGCFLQGMKKVRATSGPHRGREFLRFKTLTPFSDTSKLTREEFPQFVPKFDLVTYDSNERTIHVDTKWGPLYWILATREGSAFIPMDFVKEVT